MRKVDLIYRPEGPGWAASSPDAPEYLAYGESLAEVIQLAHEGIAFHLDVDESELNISDFVGTPPGLALLGNTGVSGLGATVTGAVAVGVNTGETVVRSTAPQSVRTAEAPVPSGTAA